MLSLIQPSEVTEFVAQLGIVFLLFFLGLEFTLGRLARSRRHAVVGGVDRLRPERGSRPRGRRRRVRAALRCADPGGAIYVSSSAITVKGLIDFRRLADDETDLVLAILVAEDLVIGLDPRVRAGGGGAGRRDARARRQGARLHHALARRSKWLSRPSTACCEWLPREFFLLAAFAFLVGMAALAEELGLSEAIGALMAGVVLSETSVRGEIEERFFSFRDVFAALFFFVFGLSIDVATIDRSAGSRGCRRCSTRRQDRRRLPRGVVTGGYTRRQGFNAGVALVAHGEFTVILAQIAAATRRSPTRTQAKLVAFAGLYVLITATLGVVLMKESKAIGRRLFPPLDSGGATDACQMQRDPAPGVGVEVHAPARRPAAGSP